MLRQSLANIFCKEPDCKYFSLRGPCHVCCNYSSLPWQQESSCRCYVHSGCGCVPTKLYLQRQAVGRIASVAWTLPALVLHNSTLSGGGCFISQALCPYCHFQPHFSPSVPFYLKISLTPLTTAPSCQSPTDALNNLSTWCN